MKYLYQRYNGRLTIYREIDDNEYIDLQTGIVTNTNRFSLLGKVSKNIIELLEDNDFVELEYKSPKYRERITRVFEVLKVDEYLLFENHLCNFYYKKGDKKITDKTCKNIKIKSVLTHEEFNKGKFEV